MHFSICIREIIKSKYIIFCIYKLSQESCTFAKWIPSCLCIIHRMQICKTFNLKYILKHQGDSEVEPKLTAHDVVKKSKKKKIQVQVGYGCEHTNNITTSPSLAHQPPTPTLSNDLIYTIYTCCSIIL